MGEMTKIAWTDHTFNPWIGCTKVSAECDHCYAEALMDLRWGKVKWGAGHPRVRTSVANWRDPAKWNRKAKADGVRRKVFCSSLADVFDAEVEQAWRDDLWTLIEACDGLDWLLLTKRPHLARKMVPVRWLTDWPKHVWFGFTAGNDLMLKQRAPHALAIPAPLIFLSYEPALGPIHPSPYLHDSTCEVSKPGFPVLALGARQTISDHCTCTEPKEQHLAWIIGGGESDQGGVPGRPDQVEWYEDVHTECRAAGVPYFHKQMARLAPIPQQLLIREFPA